MYNLQGITNPFGITVFGSSIMRVAPDVVSIHFSVSQVDDHPKDAFQKTREVAQNVRQYLATGQFEDVGSSRIDLAEATRYVNGETKFIGYRAKIEFQVLLHDLDRLEGLLSGLVDAGVNHISSVDFQTTRLKALRAQVRQQAVEAAREKAELYCAAAGVTLGNVLHIEDINPDQLRGREGHSVRETQPDDDGPLQEFDPASIVVGGAVRVGYGIGGG